MNEGQLERISKILRAKNASRLQTNEGHNALTLEDEGPSEVTDHQAEENDKVEELYDGLS
jgi:hypothetical protein